MRLMRPNKHKTVLLLFVLALICAAVAVSDSTAASKQKQKTFPTPENAVNALIDAMKADSKEELSAIFGPGAASDLSSGDKVSDKAERGRFLKAYDEKNSIEMKGEREAILLVGNDDWPLPIPIVKKGPEWHFDTKAGKEEILNRRIGRNELRVIDTMLAYVDAQREYAAIEHHREGASLYAQKFLSTPGRKDGLYWEAKEGEQQSPAGQFVAKAEEEGYTKAKSGKPSPFHGYYFRILTAQGKHATGGAYNYVVKDKMILGFGLVAYPAKYGSSGIMTFIVNQEGIVYEKDLGRNTAKKAAAIKRYDPDRTWRKVEQSPSQAAAGRTQ